jgi:hypothetical protein
MFFRTTSSLGVNIPLDHLAEEETLSNLAGFIALQARKAKLSLPEFFARQVRQSLDEVVDGPRTGRWAIYQLSTTEKTYIGTKVEILTRAALGVPNGSRLDCLIDGVETDIKWSMHETWMIGPENVGDVCLGISMNSKQTSVSVGLFIPFMERLRPKANRDRKRSLSATGQKHILWLVDKQPLAQNFVAGLNEKIRSHIFAGTTAQERIRRLAVACPLGLIPRQAFQTVAMRPDGDPLRRLRRDRYNAVGLGGVYLLSTKQQGVLVRRILGLGSDAALPKNHWLSVPEKTYLQFNPTAVAGVTKRAK